MSPEKLSPSEQPDISQYKPQGWDDVVFISILPIPERKFPEGKFVKWLAFRTPEKVIIINMIHECYPDAVCQVQCSPNDNEDYTIFILNAPLREGDSLEICIPEELADEMFEKVFPQAMSGFKKKDELSEWGEIFVPYGENYLGDFGMTIHSN